MKSLYDIPYICRWFIVKCNYVNMTSILF